MILGHEINIITENVHKTQKVESNKFVARLQIHNFYNYSNHYELIIYINR